MAQRSRASRSSAAWTADASQRIVVLAGADEHLRSLRTREIRDALHAAFASVAESRFDAAAALADVLDACRGFSLLGEHNLVIVDEADELLKASEEGEASQAPVKSAGRKRSSGADLSSPRRILERYAQAPAAHATLVLRARTWRPGNLDKLIAQAGAVVKCDAPTPEKALAWAQRLSRERLGCPIDQDAAVALVRRLGPDLGALQAELHKLAALADDAGITRELVDRFVARSRDEQAWAIQEALLAGGAAGALAELDAICASFPRDSDAVVPAAWAVADLSRKLHTACRLLQAGVTPFDAAKAASVWGPARDPLLRLAQRADAAALADLLDDAVESNAAVKGGSDPRRALETLLVRAGATLGV